MDYAFNALVPRPPQAIDGQQAVIHTWLKARAPIFCWMCEFLTPSAHLHDHVLHLRTAPNTYSPSYEESVVRVQQAWIGEARLFSYNKATKSCPATPVVWPPPGCPSKSERPEAEGVFAHLAVTVT